MHTGNFDDEPRMLDILTVLFIFLSFSLQRVVQRADCYHFGVGREFPLSLRVSDPRLEQAVQPNCRAPFEWRSTSSPLERRADPNHQKRTVTATGGQVARAQTPEKPQGVFEQMET